MKQPAKKQTGKTVLHVIDTTGPGGAETVFIQLADRLREFGYRSVVVIRGKGWVYDELSRRGLQPHILQAKGSFNFRYLFGLLRIVKKEGVDIIQSHLLGSNIYCAMVGLLTGRPVLATFHGKVDVDPNERLRWLKLLLMNLGVSRFVTVSQRLMKEIASENLLDTSKTTVIYNGVDVDRYSKRNLGNLRQSLSLPADTVLIGSLGNVRPAKAYDILIKSAARVIPQFPTIHFVIAGDPKRSMMEELKNLASANGVAAHVHFLGYCEDSAQFLAELDIYLLCSNSEGFSISTIEAMATGLPMVLTRCGGPEEIATHDLNALMVKPGDPADIATALIALLSDESLRNRLAANATVRAREAFGIQRMLEAYDELIQSGLTE